MPGHEMRLKRPTDATFRNSEAPADYSCFTLPELFRILPCWGHLLTQMDLIGKLPS